MPDRNRRGEIRAPRKYPGEISAAPLIERGFVNIGPQGTTAQYVWVVTAIGGPPELATAYATQVTGIPKMGDWHHILGVPVSNVRAELVEKSTTAAYVTVDYGLVVEGGGGWFDNEPSETAAAQIEVVSTVQSTTTNMDVDGNQILVSQWEEDEEGQQTIQRFQGGEVAYQQPMFMVIFRRRENFSPGVAIVGGRRASPDYIGHVNVAAWMGAALRMWLCTKMDGHTDDGGVTWNVTYAFQHRAPSWDATVVYRDPNTGQPIQVTDPDNETATVPLYHTADFNTLRLFG